MTDITVGTKVTKTLSTAECPADMPPTERLDAYWARFMERKCVVIEYDAPVLEDGWWWSRGVVTKLKG